MFGNTIFKAASIVCIGLAVGAGTLAAEEIPWPLAEDYSRDSRRIDEYIKSLGTTTNSKVVGEFRKKLRARVEEDKKIVAAGDKHPRYEQAKEELGRYDVFLGRMGQKLYFIFNGEVDLKKNNVAFQYAQLRIPKSSVRVKSMDGKNVYFFFGDERVYLEGEDLKEVQKQFRQLWYTLYFLQGLDDPDFKKYRAMADACLRYTSMALKNNKPENVDYKPMPTPGKLNSLAPKALALARKSSSHADAVAVVIDADDWTVERSKAGVILRRKVGGWVIKPMKRGKRAFRCQFAEPWTGNGYGELILYGIGGGQFNVK